MRIPVPLVKMEIKVILDLEEKSGILGNPVELAVPELVVLLVLPVTVASQDFLV